MGFLQKTGFRSAYKARALVVQLFEDNGRETEMEGRLATIGSLFAEKFGWEEAKSALVPFVTALLLIWLGLKQEPIKASVYSFAIVLTFALVGAVLSSLRGNGKIVWRFRRT
jgi:hypothetical protein